VLLKRYYSTCIGTYNKGRNIHILMLVALLVL
jgi:hypothetical protein